MREILRKRLTRRGVAALAEAIAPVIPSISLGRLPLVPNVLTSATVKSGTQVLAGQAITKVASTSVALLTQSVLWSLFMMKIKTIAVSLILIGVGVFGESLAAPQGDSNRPRLAPGRVSRPSSDNMKFQPARVSLGDYVVEPPDLLLVEVLEALPGRPISGERLVRPDGKISLGFYGDVYVAGLTLPEVKEKIILRLQTFLTDDGLGLVDLDADGHPKIDPQTGKPVRIDPKDSAAVFVDVTAYNSKFYYVQGAVVVPGRLQVTGNETILDAINLAGGLTPEANRDKVVLYRHEDAHGPIKALPVDINQIMLGADPTTNYQLKPGDRLVVPQLPRKDTAYEPPETNDVQTATAIRDRHVPRLHFDRRPDEHDADSVQPYRPRADRSAGNASMQDRATLRDVQKRLKDVEQKLDTILAILNSQKP